MNKKQKNILLIFVVTIVAFFGLLYLVCTHDSYDLEWRKNVAFNAVIGFLFVSCYLIPVVFFLFFTSQKFQDKDKDGVFLRFTMFFMVIGAFVIVFNIKEPIEDFIDPNAGVKRQAEMKREQIELQQRRDSIVFAQQLESYNKIQFEIEKISDKSQLCDYTEIQTYIDATKNKLEQQLLSVEATKRAMNNHLEEQKNYFSYIDSLYIESNKINADIDEIVYNETWFKRTKYIEYIIAFILGICSNLVFDVLKKRIRKSKSQPHFSNNS